MANSSQPVIPVKKSDGSVVKMTLDEFRAYKAQKAQAPAAPVLDAPVDPNTPQGTPVQPNEVVTPNIPAEPSFAEALPDVVTPESVQESVVAPEHHNLPMVEETMALSSETPTIVGETVNDLQNAEPPIPQSRVQEVEQKQPKEVSAPEPLPKEEFTSPLQDVEGEDIASHAPVSNLSESLTNDVISSLNFSLTPELQSRLSALILSRIKDIRTDSQVEQYALLGVGAGGMGFTDMQASKLMNALQEALLKRPAVDSLPSAQALLQPTSPSSASPQEPALAVTPIVVTAPISSDKKIDGQKILNSLIVEDKIQAELKNKANYTRIDTGKISVQDVVVKPRSVGPIDEMMNFSLVDLRRLGADAKSSADSLIRKFELLKKESYLLFLQGKAAWLRSPLFISYLEVLEKSLINNQPVSTLLSQEKDGLRNNEFEELIRVSQSLNC